MVPRAVTYATAAACTSRTACVDKDEGEGAEVGYRQADSKVFRRYVVKRIAKNHGEQLDLETGAYNYWVLVTNDHTSSAPPWSPSIATRPSWSRTCGS